MAWTWMKHCKAAAEHFQASNTHDPSRLESDKAGAVRLVQVLHHLQLQGDFLELFEAGTQTVVLASLFVQSQGQSTTRMGFLQCFRFPAFMLRWRWHGMNAAGTPRTYFCTSPKLDMNQISTSCEGGWMQDVEHSLHECRCPSMPIRLEFKDGEPVSFQVEYDDKLKPRVPVQV